MRDDGFRARGYVFLQFAALAWVVGAGARFPFEDGGRWVIAGLGGCVGVWAALHLGAGLTPSPLPNGAGLAVRGPYRWVRHPMYLGVLLVAGAFVAGWGSAIGWGALVAVLTAKIRFEEGKLRVRYGGYRRYCRRTWRLVPWVW